MRVHRVGTVTLGVTMIGIGIAFLTTLFVSYDSLAVLMNGWPVIFILLGIEILWGNHKEEREFVYDKTAIALIVILSVFAIFLAIITKAVELSPFYFG